jgi:hypothetical protein
VARKGKLAFSFGKFTTPVQRQQQPTVTVMMGPRASFAPFYLEGTFKDYSDKNVRLAGRKRYLPRYRDKRELAWSDIQGRLKQQHEIAPPGDKIRTALHFLEPVSGTEIRFRSTIRLHNVTKAEIGAVLWALTHGGKSAEYRHMLGRAKAFGAGQIRVDAAHLSLRPNADHKAVQREADHWPFLEAFEQRMGPGWRHSPSVTEFLACSQPGTLQDLRYMEKPDPFSRLRKAVQLMVDGSPPCHRFRAPRLLKASGAD